MHYFKVIKIHTAQSYYCRQHIFRRYGGTGRSICDVMVLIVKYELSVKYLHTIVDKEVVV